MARKLKVFSWSDGLHDYTVAATSRAKALEAWDVGRDLFKDGTAREVAEGPAHDAALDAPETVITTPAGGLGAALKALPARARRKPSKAETAREEKLAALKTAAGGRSKTRPRPRNCPSPNAARRWTPRRRRREKTSRRGGRRWRRRSGRRSALTVVIPESAQRLTGTQVNCNASAQSPGSRTASARLSGMTARVNGALRDYFPTPSSNRSRATSGSSTSRVSGPISIFFGAAGS